MQNNFSVVSESLETEGNSITMYGLSYFNQETGENLRFSTLTSNKESMEQFVALCNESEVTETTLYDLVHDFICQ